MRWFRIGTYERECAECAEWGRLVHARSVDHVLAEHVNARGHVLAVRIFVQDSGTESYILEFAENPYVP